VSVQRRLKHENIERDAARLVKAAHAPVKATRFGSYTHGTARKGSDLDLLVVASKTPNIAEEYNHLRAAIGAPGAGQSHRAIAQGNRMKLCSGE